MTLGNRLKTLLQEKQISQKQLANDLNVAQSTLNGYIQNYREPDFKTLVSLADYFSVSTDFLLGRTEYRGDFNEKFDDEILKLYNKITPEQQFYLLE